MGTRPTRELATTVPRSYCTRRIWGRQEESAQSEAEFVGVAGYFTRYGASVLRWRSMPVGRIAGWCPVVSLISRRLVSG